MRHNLHIPESRRIRFRSGNAVLDMALVMPLLIGLTFGACEYGYALYVKDKRLHYAYNYVAAELFKVCSDKELPTGKLELRFEFEPTGKPDIPKGKGAPGRAQLYVNAKLVGELDLPYTVPLVMGLGGGICVGRDEARRFRRLHVTVELRACFTV